MRRREVLLALAGLPVLGRAAAGPEVRVRAGATASGAGPAAAPMPPMVSERVVFDPVLPGRPLRFPADHGAHPGFRTEWWYATGWLRLPDGSPLGFQTTFFRVRTGIGEDNPSAFAPRQLLLAHAALADPRLGRLRHDQRAARAGFGLAGAVEGYTDAWIGDWRFAQDPPAQDPVQNPAPDRYRARVQAESFGYDLTLIPAGPPVPNGAGGFSAKAPDPRSASYYYSRPQLTVTGQVTLDGRTLPVTGRAWLDHEWSSEYLPAGAQGWDWVGLNLDDGSALMAFRMRAQDGPSLWAAATLSRADGRVEVYPPDAVDFAPVRRWRSPRTGIEFPVAWRLRVGERRFALSPLMDDQELDSRGSTGAVYWEGAVRVTETDRETGLESGLEIGRGYLEMTGYGERIQVG